MCIIISLWALSSICNAWASEHHLYLHRWCSQVDALQLASAEYCKDRGFFGLRLVDASICYQCHPSKWVPTKSCQFPLSATSTFTWTLMCHWGGDWKRETWHRETIKIVEADIARPDKSAPYRKGGHRETCFIVPVEAHYKLVFAAGSIIWAAHRLHVYSFT